MIRKILTKSVMIIATCLTTSLFASAYTPIAIATPVIVGTYSYDKTIPLRYTTRFTYHNGFANIYLDDGSVWKTEYSTSIAEAKTWLINDTIVIKEDSWLGGYTLHNTRKNKDLSVAFSCPADPNFINTYIYMESYANSDNVLTLRTNAGGVYYMQVRNSELYITNKWYPQDSIILGWNKDDFSWDLDYPYTLINTRTNDKVRAESVIYTY